MSTTYFIADTHFYHEKIIGYENRPFGNVEEMNEAMIENWNKVVCKGDRIFVLGDLMFHPNQNLSKIVPRLRGNKILVMGNHDCVRLRAYMEAGFREVYKYPIILDNFWILSHEPMYINSNMPYANIFGHVHSNPEYLDYSPQSICVSVERKHMNYTPIAFEQVKKLMGLAE